MISPFPSLCCFAFERSCIRFVRRVAGVFGILISRPAPSLALEGCPLVRRDDTKEAPAPERPRVGSVDEMRRALELLVTHRRAVPLPLGDVPDFRPFRVAVPAKE